MTIKSFGFPSVRSHVSTALLSALAVVLAVLLLKAMERPDEFAQESGTRWRKVVRVVSADRLVLDDNEVVRLLGIRVLRGLPSKLQDTVDEMSTEFARKLALGRLVWLKSDFDGWVRDPQGALRAYVYIEDGTMLNIELLEQGYVMSGSLVHPTLTAHYKEIENKAREERKGIWGLR